MTTDPKDDVTVARLEARVKELEMCLAREARVVEAQASLETDSKYIGKQSKEFLRTSVERLRLLALGESVVYLQGGRLSDPYKSLIHERKGHQSDGWFCQACADLGL